MHEVKRRPLVVVTVDERRWIPTTKFHSCNKRKMGRPILKECKSTDTDHNPENAMRRKTFHSFSPSFTLIRFYTDRYQNIFSISHSGKRVCHCSSHVWSIQLKPSFLFSRKTLKWRPFLPPNNQITKKNDSTSKTPTTITKRYHFHQLSSLRKTISATAIALEIVRTSTNNAIFSDR